MRKECLISKRHLFKDGPGAYRSFHGPRTFTRNIRRPIHAVFARSCISGHMCCRLQRNPFCPVRCPGGSPRRSRRKRGLKESGKERQPGRSSRPESTAKNSDPLLQRKK
jgi:hypothetical protein